jgi:hypothetical protein
MRRAAAADRCLFHGIRGGFGHPLLRVDARREGFVIGRINHRYCLASVDRFVAAPLAITKNAVTSLRHMGFALLIGAFAAGAVTVALADETPPAAARTGDALTTRAMRWITEAMAGETDRSQYSPAFAPQVTDDAVARMAHDLNVYGAAPLRAEIVQTKKEGDQTFAIVKFVFPRGDATSLIFGFDAEGKITGAVGGMAGD